MNLRPALYVSVGMLMVVSIIELSFIAATVGFLHDTAAGLFAFRYNGQSALLNGKPEKFLVDQGHTANGAAGTAFILVGIGGFLALGLRSRRNAGKFSHIFYYAWLVITVLALLLTFSALIFVFVVTNKYKNQVIDQNIAARLDGDAAYPVGTWTPQGWFAAVLQLYLSDQDVRRDIQLRLRIMRGWQWNLIAFFLVQLIQTGLAFWDAANWRKETKTPRVHETSKQPFLG